MEGRADDLLVGATEHSWRLLSGGNAINFLVAPATSMPASDLSGRLSQLDCVLDLMSSNPKASRLNSGVMIWQVAALAGNKR